MSRHVVALLPVNALVRVKTRLAERLKPIERQRLALTLLRHVIVTLKASGEIHEIIVVCPDAAVLTTVEQLGVIGLQHAAGDLNADLIAARDVAIERGATEVLALLPDLAKVTTDDVRALARAGATVAVVLAPDHRQEGTNALWLNPPDAIPFSFGSDSFRRHEAAAQRRQHPIAIVRRDGLAADVDRPEDLGGLETWISPPETAVIGQPTR